MVFCIITLSSVADLTSSEIDEVSENTEDKEKTDKFNSLVKEGDSFYWHSSCINNLYFLKAIESYNKALEIDSTNQEVLFKIAYYYDIMDSVNLAKQYYQKINAKYLKIKDNYKNIEYPEIHVKKVIDNFMNENSFVEKFRKFGKKSSITLDYYYSNNHKYILYPNWFDYYIREIFYKKIFFTIYGNGDFEARNYELNSDSKKYFRGKLPDSILIKILQTIENGRIISLKKLFVDEESEINHFYGINDCMPPADFLFYPLLFERTRIESPIFSYFVLTENVERSRDRIFSPRSDSVINLNYNNTLEDKVEAKLQLLSELWKYIFWMDLSKYSTD